MSKQPELWLSRLELDLNKSKLVLSNCSNVPEFDHEHIVGPRITPKSLVITEPFLAIKRMALS